MNSRQRRRFQAERHNQAREQAIRERQARMLFRWLWLLYGNGVSIERSHRRRAQRLLAFAAASVGAIGRIDYGANQ